MTTRKDLVVAVLATFCLIAVLSTRLTSSSSSEYAPWLDVNDDGRIDMKDIVQEILHFGSKGEPITKASIEFDGGWVDITDKAGQYITITHNLDSMDVMVDITGKTTVDGGLHQRHLGGTDYVHGWNKTYGGGLIDAAYSMIQTSDGGYALLGVTQSFGAGDWDFWLVKTDQAGNAQWNKTYGGTQYDWAQCVVQTGDDGYALAGYTQSYGAGSNDGWLVKTDSLGNHLWNKTYGGANNDGAESFVQTSDGGYVGIGSTASFGPWDFDFYLLRTDSAGNLQWNKTYGGTSDDFGNAVIQTADGGFAMAGTTGSFGAGSRDFWLIKTDANGNLQWSKTYGGVNQDSAVSMIQTGDGGYALCGQTWSFGGSLNAWLVKTDSTGTMQWNKAYGGEPYDEMNQVVQTVDSGYAIVGDTYSFGAGSADMWLIKTDAAGNALDGFKYGLAWVNSTANTITLYRGTDDAYWNYVQVRIWKIRETP